MYERNHMVMPKVLIVEDEPQIALLETRKLEEAGYPIEVVETGEAALEFIERGDIDMVLLDHKLPGISGEEVLKQITEKNLDVPVIVMTRYGSEKFAADIIKSGAKDYIVKDSELSYVNSLPKIIIANHRRHLMEKEAKRLQEQTVYSEARLARAQVIGKIGDWELDVSRNRISWSDEHFRIFGFGPKEFEPTHESFIKCLHPGDIESVEKAMQKALYENIPLAMEFRIIRPNGAERVIFSQAEVYRGEDGMAIKMHGTVQDITERKKAEEELNKAYEELSEKTVRLEKFQRTTVGREVEMVKLKEEVNSLLEKLGLLKKYEAP